MAWQKGNNNVAKRPKVREILRKQKLGEGNPQWKGGKVKIYSHADKDKSNPYIKVKVHSHPYADSQNYVMEHRLVMEECLGRYLGPNEYVHHENGIKADNRIENLRIVNGRSKHAKLHPENIRKAFKHSPTTFKKGYTPWTKGRKLSEEHKRKIGEANKKSVKEYWDKIKVEKEK